MSLNLLILIDSLKFGGAEKQAVLDANNLSKCRMSVSLAFFSNGPLIEELSSSVKPIKIEERSYFSRIKSLRKIIKKDSIDVIHAHMFRAEIVGAVAGMFSGMKVILNEHGLGLWRGRHHILCFRFAAMFADKVLCTSEACRKIRRMKEHIPSKKLKTVYNSFKPFSNNKDTDSVKRLKNKIRSSLGVEKNDSLFIGFVGRFDRVKRLHLIIELAMRIRHGTVVFVLVGDGEDRQRIEQLINREGLENRFFIPGFVHNPKEYYEIFDIFVLPSIRESLSISLLEAGGCGIPAIAFDVGGNREVISDGETGYVIPEKDFEAFFARVKKLVSEKELRRRLGETAAFYITHKFSEERRLSGLLSSYGRFVKTGS